MREVRCDVSKDIILLSDSKISTKKIRFARVLQGTFTVYEHNVYSKKIIAEKISDTWKALAIMEKQTRSPRSSPSTRAYI